MPGLLLKAVQVNAYYQSSFTTFTEDKKTAAFAEKRTPEKAAEVRDGKREWSQVGVVNSSVWWCFLSHSPNFPNW